MPRRRPPGAGPGLSSLSISLVAAIFVLPWIAAAAQQQQPPQNAHQKSPREEAYAESIIQPNARKPNQGQLAHASKRDPYTPLIAQNERAVATKVSPAPADLNAVRAPPARNAAHSRGLTRPSARSLQDWSVEDFVLLATVDGHLHARDRYNGDEIWELDIGQPMLETIYHVPNQSEGDHLQQTPPFMWIVEPKEDGTLYILTPGRQPVLQSLGMTIKDLAETLSPYTGTSPPYVYTAEKKNKMHIVDARTGLVKKTFSPGGSSIMDNDRCGSSATEFFDARERECTGFFNLGQTEYTVSIHNSNTGDNICTIRYFEWTANNRDVDLRAQYVQSRDNQYIYSRYDGNALAYNHNRPKRAVTKRPVFERKFSYPVVRVFDVARPPNDEDPDPALVLLPQPLPPGVKEDKKQHVWLNTTETGSWYALSEENYPAVTDSAPEALCYSPEWNGDLLTRDGEPYFPHRAALVGVHSLEQDNEHDSMYEQHNDFLQIGASMKEDSATVSGVPIVGPTQTPPQITIGAPNKAQGWDMHLLQLCVLLIVAALTGWTFREPSKLDSLKSLISRFTTAKKVEAPVQANLGPSKSEPQILDVKPSETPLLDTSDTQTVVSQVPSTEAAVTDPAEGPEERRVRFDIPDDAESEMEPLSRTTTAEELSPGSEFVDVNGMPEASADGIPSAPNGASGGAKKKKTHRGKRGGTKKSKKLKENDDEVDQAVQAAKELDQAPTLHPDELAVNGDDVQDVSSIKKIGKLTIDFDRLLGNGSGGTFVFEGKWNEREVAVKRMLPQYFGLAEQEIKLLQESDLHPNVIRYFDDEKDENFLYIAVELCQASLWDLYRDGRPEGELSDVQGRLVNEINIDVPRALYQLALGLNHLHSLRIIHRDIKPQNILIAYPQRNSKGGPRLVISDFGLCKTLPDNVSTLIGTTGNAGTVGWKAPELILQPKDVVGGSSTGHSRDSSTSTDPVAQGVKRSVDIFSLGCVFFYVLTNGSHPFDDDEGWMQVRELNIKKNKSNLKQLNLGDDSEEPIHLISWMLSNKPEDRPTAIQVMNHPFFWSAEKRLTFLCDCSDHWERESRDPPSEHLSILEECRWDVLDKKQNFLGKLDHAFINSLGKQRKYTGDRMLDLLRALRNKKNHYEDMDETVKAKVGPLPHGYLRYWTTKFPKLLMSCYQCVKDCGLENEPRFKPYFDTPAGV